MANRGMTGFFFFHGSLSLLSTATASLELSIHSSIIFQDSGNPSSRRVKRRPAGKYYFIEQTCGTCALYLYIRVIYFPTMVSDIGSMHGGKTKHYADGMDIIGFYARFFYRNKKETAAHIAKILLSQCPGLHHISGH